MLDTHPPKTEPVLRDVYCSATGRGLPPRCILGQVRGCAGNVVARAGPFGIIERHEAGAHRQDRPQPG